MKNHQLRNWQTIKLLKLCFNPHTHEGCDGKNQLSSNKHQVSIHTPTKGVTQIEYCRHYHDSVSIHTPIQGVTRFIYRFFMKWLVSIHTPIQGVTLSPLWVSSNCWCFNPHTHTGCDTIQIAILTKFISFNPHTHTGCDYQYVYHQNQPNQFQSTHPYRVWLIQR